MSVSVLVPYGGPPDIDRARARAWVLRRYASEHPAWELVIGCDGRPWSKGRAVADAYAQATGEILVIADADSYVDVDLLERTVAVVEDGAPWAYPHRLVHRLSRTSSRAVTYGIVKRRWTLDRRPHMAPAGGGIVVLTRAAYEAVGGIDPRFEGWGGEDIAFGWALDTLAGEGVCLDGILYHLWHEPHRSGRGSPATERLAGRYLRARGDAAAMAELVAR